MATAFSVLGGDRSLVLAEQLGLAIYIIEHSDEGLRHRYSAAFSGYLEQESQ